MSTDLINHGVHMQAASLRVRFSRVVFETYLPSDQLGVFSHIVHSFQEIYEGAVEEIICTKKF